MSLQQLIMMKFRFTNGRINIILLFLFIVFGSCSSEEPISVNSEDYHIAVDKITKVMIHDIFSPPVASRIFTYPNIAAYEILRQEHPEYSDLAGRLNELTPIPTPENPEDINYSVAAIAAYYDIGRMLIFSEDRVQTYADSIFKEWRRKNPKQFERSKEYGLRVAEHIKAWISTDNYKQTRTMPKFTINTDDPSRWQPTPPAYMDGIEPHWSKIRPFVMDSAQQFKPIPPPSFSLEEGTPFYSELKEVYDIGNSINEQVEENERLEIAKFWDCNPYVSVQRGHLMFATKKITPGAHWIGITKIACRKENYDLMQTVYAYTKTSIAIADAFISCWDEKYRSNLIRPETLINQHIDEDWKPILQTPPFPEYVSGHSVVSGAASEVLTEIFGDNFEFRDDTEEPFGLTVRTFKSFRKAAEEAALSRLYGGIHYRAAIEVGLDQGRKVGQLVVSKLDLN